MRHFPIKNKPYGDNGGWRKVALINCHKCHKDHFIAINAGNNGSVLPDEAVAKKFLGEGWAIGRDEKHDVCPECVQGHVAKVVMDKPVTHAHAVRIATGAVVAQPKEMTKEDRRIIFAKLDDVYVNEQTGYSKDWSDHRVATDLGTPRAWVEIVRKEMFGEIATNPETHSFLTEVDEKIAELKDVWEEVSKVKRLIDKFTHEHGPVLARAAKFADCIESLEKRANEIRKRGM